MNIDVLEYQVLSTIKRRNEFQKVQHLLNEDLFESSQTKRIYKLIRDYQTRASNPILQHKDLVALVQSAVKPENFEKYVTILNRIKKYRVANTEVAEEIVYKWAKRQNVKAVILEAADMLDGTEDIDLERLQQRLDKASRVNQTSDENDTDYFIGTKERIAEEKSLPRIHTYLDKRIDGAIRGGLAPGEIGVIIGPTGTGKSLILCNIAHAAFKQGKKVVYVTLELHARTVAIRMDIRVSGRPFGEISEDSSSVTKKLKLFKERGADLRIKDYTSTAATVSDIKAYLRRKIENGFMPDLLLVDHVDLMFAQKSYSDRRFELSSIVAALRRLGAELNIPVWTASQGTRLSGQKGKTEIWDVAEDIGKINWADVAITISQTEQEKEDGVMHLKLGKNRIGRGNPKVVVNVDYDVLKVSGRVAKVLDKAKEGVV